MQRWSRTFFVGAAVVAMVLAGTAVQAISVAGPSVAGTWDGSPYDRVSPGESLAADAVPDVLYKIEVTYAGTHDLTSLHVGAGSSMWNTVPGDGLYIAGVTGPAAGAPFLHAADADIDTQFTDSASYWVYLADDGALASGATTGVKVCFDHSADLCAFTTVTPEPDADNDGFKVQNDCNDNDASFNPDATDVPDDGLDQDCDGAQMTTWHPDADGDGYGAAGSTGTADETQPAQTSVSADDCDDADADTYPYATENAANGKDDDCDDMIDERLWWPDVDEDGYGGFWSPTEAETQPAGHYATHDDCNDLDPDTHPGAADSLGDDVDQDCSGADGPADTWYADGDSDGYGDAAVTESGHTQPSGYVANATDCNDGNANVHPGATEVAGNDVDEDCDGADGAVWHPDADADGFGSAAGSVVAGQAPNGYVSDDSDCNDASNQVYPGAPETAGNDVDEDCDGADLKAWYADGDDDGYGAGTATTANAQPNGHVSNDDDCNDASNQVHPGATETAGNDVDEDCDGADLKNWYPDTDDDGYGAGTVTQANTQPNGHTPASGDCDDGNAAVNPDATEVPDNGVDENCDGLIMATWYADTDSDGYGDAATSTTAASQPADHSSNDDDCDDSNGDAYPGATDTPGNGVDEDCDGADAVAVNNAPVAQNSSPSVGEDAGPTTLTLTATDADDDALTFTIVGLPAYGTLGTPSAPDCSAVNVCTTTVDYTPASNYSGPDTFTFYATDTSSTSSADGTVSITVTPAADATTFGPVSSSNGYFTNKGTRVTLASTVLSTDPACVAGRSATFTVTGGTLSSPVVLPATSTGTGAISVQTTLPPGVYSVALSATATSACAAGSADPAGSFTIKSTKKPK